MKTVLSLCDESTIMVQPWLEAGYECICVDLRHPRGETREGNLIRVGANILHWIPPQRDYVQAYAFPSCTHGAVSGARWFKGKGLRGLIEYIELVERCRAIIESIGASGFIENPVSTLSTYWRKPDYAFDPHQYGGYLNPPGDAYTKKTCLWSFGGFIMPEPRSVDPELGSKMHLLPPSPDRDQLRSKTPEGFSRAVFEANHQQIRECVA